MFERVFNRDFLFMFLSVFAGTMVGMASVILFYRYNLYVMGVNVSVFVSPVIAGFVETIVSKFLVNRSSGAISAIVLFFVTNGIGWLFPKQPLTLTVFTVGGVLLMLQAAFPLLMNYLLITLIFLITYVLGLGGEHVAKVFHNLRKTNSTKVGDIEDTSDLGVHIFNNCPDIPIKEYHGLLFSEKIVEFEDKNFHDKLEYMGSNLDEKMSLKHRDYELSKKFVLNNLQKEAIMINANAIIDVEFEYTNYNQQIPPDVLIAVYGTAVTIDEKYL